MEQYPTEEELKTISEWSIDDFYGLMAYIETIWAYAGAGYFEEDGSVFKLHTAGWSGNESIIKALQQNTMFWTLCWVQSRRGGHFIFEAPRLATRPENGYETE